MRTLSALRILTGLCLLLCFAASVSGAEQQSINLSLGEAVQTTLLKNLGLRLSKENVVSAEGTACNSLGRKSQGIARPFGFLPRIHRPRSGRWIRGRWDLDRDCFLGLASQAITCRRSAA